MRILPNLTNYTWFFYLGIFFFLAHLMLFGLGLNQSYFGLILIYIGWRKPALYTWFIYVLWFLIVVDVIANVRRMVELIKPKYAVIDKRAARGPLRKEGLTQARRTTSSTSSSSGSSSSSGTR